MSGDIPCADIPYAELDALFIDVGNTLVSLDFALLSRMLAERSFAVDPTALGRAEAAIRPRLSARVREESTETSGTLRFYLRAVLDRALGPDRDLDALVDDLAPRLERLGRTRLWSQILPGTVDALERLAARGLRRIVVSNSDGTVRELLASVGLLPLLDGVIDSGTVGIEKPNPGIFLHALQLSGSDPQRTAHIGDLYHADVVGARRAGIHPVLVDPFGDWTDVDCVKVRDLSELVDRIEASR